MPDDHDLSQDAELMRVARRRYRLTLWIALGLGFLPVVVIEAFFVYLVVVNDAPWWVVPIVLVPPGVSVAAMAFVVRLRQNGHRWFPGPIRLGGADRATQRRVRRAVQRGRLPAIEPDRSLGLELARAMDSTRWTRWTIPFMLIPFGINAVVADESWIRWTALAFILAFGPVGIWNWRMYAKVHALVEAHHRSSVQSAVDL